MSDRDKQTEGQADEKRPWLSIFYISALLIPVVLNLEFWPFTSNSLFDLRLNYEQHVVAILKIPGRTFRLPLQASVAGQLKPGPSRTDFLVQFVRSNLPYRKLKGTAASITLVKPLRGESGGFTKEEQLIWEGIL